MLKFATTLLIIKFARKCFYKPKFRTLDGLDEERWDAKQTNIWTNSKAFKVTAVTRRRNGDYTAGVLERDNSAQWESARPNLDLPNIEAKSEVSA